MEKKADKNADNNNDDKDKGSPKKKAASEKKEKDRTPLFIRDLTEKCRNNNVEEYIIPYILNQKPKAGQVWNAYLADKESISGYSNEACDDMIKIFLGYPNYDKTGHLLKIFFKHTKLPMNFLFTFGMVLKKYEHVTTLYLIDCNLSKHAIESLHTHISDMPNIYDISLEGNPVTAQNHGIFASNDYVKFLSLKRCKLNVIGIELLYENIIKPRESKLQVLNLTGNYIDDNAAFSIGKILRENRTITTLMLADNWITDNGFYHIIMALQSFHLTEEEIVRRRSISINYIRQKIKIAEEYKKEKIHIRLPPTPPASTKSKKSAKSKKKDQNKRTSNINEMNKQITDLIENAVPKITHPFITQTHRNSRGDLICSGNLVLGFINLAYNKLSVQSYKWILEVLTYQSLKESLGAGISYVVLNGNADLQSLEFEDITRSLLDKSWRLEARYKTTKGSTDIEDISLSSPNSTA